MVQQVSNETSVGQPALLHEPPVSSTERKVPFSDLLFPIFSLSISSKGPGIKAETLRTEDRRHCPVKALSLLSTLEVNASHNEMSAYLFFLFRTDWQTAYSRDPDWACWTPCRSLGFGEIISRPQPSLRVSLVPP